MNPEPLPITAIGDSLSYADGAEAGLLEVLRFAGDRRVGSDEVASAVCDWPTAYHLAPERATLLVPLTIGPHDRVLDVGAGSGVNTRICADRGASVTAVEGSAARAELIAYRCAGLDGVEVLCGQLDGLDHDRAGAYDVALLIGVLEYSGTSSGGGGGPAALLERVAGLLKPGGVVVMAIENRLGLKYLLGYPEDHLGMPWVGWEGYRAGEPTTWSRRQLARMLADAGLTAQKWLYPFPDYKLATTVLSERLYHRPDAADLVEQLVGHPTSGEYARPVLVADDRAAHRTMVEAGLGPEVANSFLVVAGRSTEGPAVRVDEKVLAWRVAPDRRRCWTQLAEIVAGDEPGENHSLDHGPGLTVRRRLLAPDRDGDFDGWLGQDEVSEEPYHAGRNLEQCILDRAREGEAGEVAELLRMWRSALAAQEAPAATAGDTHPYLPADAARILPPQWLDAGPDNFVVTPGGLELVDREWVAAGGVDVRLAVVRGLWKTVSSMLSARCTLPWPATWSNDRLVVHLGELIGQTIDSELLARWRQAEAELIARVYRQPEVRLAELHDAGGRSRMDQLLSSMAPYRSLEHEVQRLRAVVAELSDAHEVMAAHERAQARVGHMEAEVVRAEQEQGRLRSELAEAQARLARVAWRERIHAAASRIIRRR